LRRQDVLVHLFEYHVEAPASCAENQQQNKDIRNPEMILRARVASDQIVDFSIHDPFILNIRATRRRVDKRLADRIKRIFGTQTPIDRLPIDNQRWMGINPGFLNLFHRVPLITTRTILQLFLDALLLRPSLPVPSNLQRDSVRALAQFFNLQPLFSIPTVGTIVIPCIIIAQALARAPIAKGTFTVSIIFILCAN
jgi:hypothetical protein